MKSGVNIKYLRYLILAAFIVAIVFTRGLSSPVNAQSPQELYKNATQLYKSNQFQQAVDTYEKILAQSYKSAEVYYNLGNCYYKLNRVGKSILSYERALKFSPKDEDIQHNLKLAQLKAIDKIQPVPQLPIIEWWKKFVSFNSSKEWGIYSLVLIWFSLLAFAVSFFIGYRRIFNSLAVIFLVSSLTFLFLAARQKHSEENSNVAILMVTNSFVKSAPDANASDLFMIHEGIRLRILDQVGNWNKIRLADGKVGWVEKENLEKI